MITEAVVQRDEDGYWTHPAVPDFGEDAEAFKNWMQENKLNWLGWLLDDDPDAADIAESYFDSCNPNVSAWNPNKPHGDGWFLLSLHDTEDGPYVLWVRRIEAEVNHD